MNNLAFQIYGTKKETPFQSVWKTDTPILLGGEAANRGALSVPSDWTLGPGGGTNLFTAGYTHGASGSNPLPFGMTMTAGQSYQIICTFSTGSTGSVIINFGNAPSATISTGTPTTTITLRTTTDQANFRITPVGFIGNIKLSIRESSSVLNQIQLPITLASGKSIWIDWGDGQYSTANSSNIIQNGIHTYTTPGEYPIRILGDAFNFAFGIGTISDKLKIKSISSWGKLKMRDASFFGCSNVTMSGITDIPDLTGVTSLSYSFYGCSNLTTIGRINEWNTSSVSNMSGVFSFCTNFNSDISNWNVSSAITMAYMFEDARAFNQTLEDWNVASVNNMQYMFKGATAFNNGFASGVSVGNQLDWNTSNCTNMFFMFNGATAFNSNLGTGTTPWDVSRVTTFAGMFSGASNFNNGDDTPPINNWSINSGSSVSMVSMFNNADAFNRPISNWNMTKVISTNNMFAYTNIFNQSLSNWERAGSTMVNVTDMSGMFQGTNAFNQDISNWNVSGVTNFLATFADSSSFNNGSDANTNLITLRTGINGWNINTASTVNMSSMFKGSGGDRYVIFNRPIGNWDTSKVNNMSNMFGKSGNGNHAFNQYIGDWDTSSVTDMSYMFQANQGDGTSSQFNQDISKWDVSNVTNFSFMLSARQFTNGDNNQQNPITSRIGINGWDINTEASVNMTGMFQNAFAFNRNIGSWNISNVTNFSNFMFGKTSGNFSSTNLNAIYNGWSSLPAPGVKPNISISFGTAKYSQAGKPGKDTLLASPNNWTITDGLLTVSGTSNNGGLIRVTTSTLHGFTTGDIVNIYGVEGTLAANGTWTIDVVNSTTIQLRLSTYDAAWTRNGNVIFG